ncbi:MAG: hypothetical protein A2020_08020 [Lentisphaerae bacterium GWF2_45_14]|nr:MAG: hypothetical protein A2020_08020 [Lentisphaerae bacterium GWF2_45_14]
MRKRYFDCFLTAVLAVTFLILIRPYVYPYVVSIFYTVFPNNIFGDILMGIVFTAVLSLIILKGGMPLHLRRLYLGWKRHPLKSLRYFLISLRHPLKYNRHFPTWLRYPPTWAIALLSLIGISFLYYCYLDDLASWRMQIWIYGIFLLSIILAKLLVYFCFGTKIPKKIVKDEYDRKVVAEKIARYIQDPKGNIALVGSFGSGKTTILEWVEDELKKEPYTICWIDSWGRKKDGFVKHILSEGLKSLKNRFDVLSFSGLPQEYSEALSDVGFFGKLFGLSTKSTSAEDVILSLDNALGVMGGRLIYFIEDVDRNKESDLLTVELPAFLDRIKNTKNIRFVIAIDTEIPHAPWLQRITSYTERLLAPKSEFRRELNEFRSKKNVETDGVIIFQEEDDFISSFYLAASKQSPPSDILPELFPNIRQFKAIWEQMTSDWNNLRGEVVFDELLVINTIKNIYPSVFDYIDSNIQMIQNMSSSFGDSGFDEEQKKRLKNAKQELNKIIGDANGRVQDSFHNLIDFLFPSWNSEMAGHVYPQGVRNNKYTNYWKRIKRGCLEKDELPDQEVLKAIQDFIGKKIDVERNSDEDEGEKGFEQLKSEQIESGENIAKNMLTDSRWSNKTKQFSELIGGYKLRNLASIGFKIILEDYENISKKRDVLNCFCEIRKPIDIEMHRKWVIGEIKKALPRSLFMANTIVKRWKNNNSPGGCERGSYDRKTFEDYFKYTKECWNSSANFINSLEEEYPFTLFDFCIRYPHDSGYYTTSNTKPTVYCTSTEDQYAFAPSAWKWLGKLMIKSLEIDSVKILSQFAYFFIPSLDSVPSDNSVAAPIKNECLKEWLGDEGYEAVMKAFADIEDLSVYKNEEAQTRVGVMQAYVQEYFRKKVLIASSDKSEISLADDIASERSGSGVQGET